MMSDLHEGENMLQNGLFGSYLRAKFSNQHQSELAMKIEPKLNHLPGGPSEHLYYCTVQYVSVVKLDY